MPCRVCTYYCEHTVRAMLCMYYCEHTVSAMSCMYVFLIHKYTKHKTGLPKVKSVKSVAPSL